MVSFTMTRLIAWILALIAMLILGGETVFASRVYKYPRALALIGWSAILISWLLILSGR